MNWVNSDIVKIMSSTTTGVEFDMVKPKSKNGAHILFDITSGCSLVNKISMQIYGIAQSGKQYLLFDSIDMTTNTMYVFKHAPFVVQNIVSGKAIGQSDYLPDYFKLITLHATNSPITYSIDFNYI